MMYPVEGAMADNSSSRLKSSIYVPLVYKLVSFLSNGALLLSPTAFNAAVSVYLLTLTVKKGMTDLSHNSNFMTSRDKSDISEKSLLERNTV